MDFKRKHGLKESTANTAPGGDNFKKEYKSSRDALGEFSPFRWRQQWTLIKNFTPEETETLERCMTEFKKNTKYYFYIFGTSTVAFSYWQR